MKLKLTEQSLKSHRELQAPHHSGKQAAVFDDKLAGGIAGFGVLISGTTSARSFFVQYDIRGQTTRRNLDMRVEEVSLQAAKKRAREYLHLMRQGIDPVSKDKTGMTLQECLDIFLDKQSLRDKTAKNYKGSIELYLKPWLNKPLSSITKEMVVARHRNLPAEVAADTGGRYDGYATADQAMRSLRAVWNYMALEGVVPEGENPTRILRGKRMWYQGKKYRSRTRFLQHDQLPAFWAALDAYHNPVARAFLKTLMLTGLRRTECSLLRWSDIDMKRRLITVPKEMTKTNTELQIPFSDLVFDTLTELLALGRATNDMIFWSNGNSGHIVSTEHPLRQIGKQTGIVISAHDFRRGFKTIASKCGIQEVVRDRLCNHAPTTLVARSYEIPALDDLAHATQLITDRFKSLCGISKPKVVKLRA